MFRSRRARTLALVGLVAFAAVLAARRRRRRAPIARLVERPDAVASDAVSDEADTGVETTGADGPADQPEPEHSSARVFAAPSDDVAVLEDEAQTDAVPDDTAQTDTVPVAPVVDLERIGRDLDGVEQALRRLDDGSYWTDEITGAPLDEALLIADPVARRNVA